MTARDSGEKRGQTGKVSWMIPGKTLTDDHDYGGLFVTGRGGGETKVEESKAWEK